MDEIRHRKLKRIVFERLTLGASKETLRQTLLTRMDTAEAEEMLDEAVREITRRRASGGYSTFAHALRRREFERPYLKYKIIAGVLAGSGAILMLISVLAERPLYLPLLPAGIAAAIMIMLEKTVREKMSAASAAVTRLVDEAA